MKHRQRIKRWQRGFQEVLVFAVYYEDDYGREITDPSVLADHAGDHSVDFALISDPGHNVADRYWDYSIPHYVLLAPGLEVRHSDWTLPSQARIAAALPGS